MSDLDQHLRDALDRAAERAAWTPTSSAAVAGRARRVRRRRQAGIVVAAATLVAAVAVPVALTGGGDEAGPAVPRDPAAAPPRIGYAVDGVYRVPGGGLVGLPAGTTSVTPTWEDTLLVGVGTADSLRLRELDTSRADTEGTPGRSRPVTRLNGYGPLQVSTSAPVVDDQGLWSYTLVLPEQVSNGLSVAVEGYEDPERSFTRGLPDDAVLLGVDHDTQRLVFLEPASGRVATILPQQSPRTGTTVPGIDLVQDYSAATRLFSDATPDGRGGGVVDDTGRRLWEGVGTVPGALSPDGTRVLAAAGDELQVRDARTGEVLGVLPGAAAPDGPEALRDLVWEDDGHLLATRPTDAGSRQLVRVGPGGTVTPLAVPTVAGDADVIWDTRP